MTIAETPQPHDNEQDERMLYGILNNLDRPEETLPFVAELGSDRLNWAATPSAVVHQEGIFIHAVGDPGGLMACYRRILDRLPAVRSFPAFIVTGIGDALPVPPGYTEIGRPVLRTRWTAETPYIPVPPLITAKHAYIQTASTATDAEEIGFWFDAFHVPTVNVRADARRFSDGLPYAALLVNGYPVAFCGTDAISSRWQSAMVGNLHIDDRYAGSGVDTVLIATLSRHLQERYGILHVGLDLKPELDPLPWEQAGFTPYPEPVRHLSLRKVNTD